jgi:SAM-dependent methyltransferase
MKESLVRDYFDRAAFSYGKRQRKFYSFHRGIADFYASIIPEGMAVLEVGCATGGLLNLLKPREGVGIDISSAMIGLAKNKYPHLSFFCASLSDFASYGPFDYIVLSNLLDYSDDLMDLFRLLKPRLAPHTKIIITTVNPLWQPIIWFLERSGLKERDPLRNFITNRDVINILNILDYETIEYGYRLPVPFYIPFFSGLLNRLISRLPVLNNLCLLQYIVARDRQPYRCSSCSVIVPCFNEEKNIQACLNSLPEFGAETEIIVVDDGSTDATADRVREIASVMPSVRLISYAPNRGKGYALQVGFKECRGDVVIILDADMSVSPREAPRFFAPIAEGKAEFVNGTRMIYPIEKRAMSFLRFAGNKFFGIVMSILMGQRNTDVLCGTKSFLRRYLPYIRMGRCRWGDFDLLLGAAKLKMKMVEMPVHYNARVAGKSKMRLLRDSLHFLKVCWRGFIELG